MLHFGELESIMPNRESLQSANFLSNLTWSDIENVISHQSDNGFHGSLFPNSASGYGRPQLYRIAGDFRDIQIFTTHNQNTKITSSYNQCYCIRLKWISLSAVMIGFSEDDYTGDEGKPGDVSRPNTPCSVTVEIIERNLEFPLQIRLTPGEGNATSKTV